MLEVNRVSCSYDGVVALRGVSCSVAPGELVAVVGDNGCGKSTLGRCMCAAQLVDEGSVVVDGHDPSVSELERLQVRTLVGRVSQDPVDHIVSSVVFDDVAFGPRNLGLSEDEVAARVERALDAVGMLDKRDALCSELSGGELQRVAFAGIMSMRPRYLVLDEVTAQLDPWARASLRQLIRDLVDTQHLGVVCITHDADEIFLADRVITLGVTTVRPPVTPAQRAHRTPSQEVALDMEGVSMQRGDRMVLCDVSLSLRAGEVVLMTGRSGAGKSTCAAIAAGLLEPTSGSVLLGCAPSAPARVGLALQQPESQFFLDTVYDEIAFAPVQVGLDQDEVDARVRHAAALVGLDAALLPRSPFELSGGQARRVALASVISLQASVYIFDEPSAALDAPGRQAVHEVVDRLAAAGASVLVISHDVDEWRCVADREVVLDAGCLHDVHPGSVPDSGDAIVLTCDAVQVPREPSEAPDALSVDGAVSREHQAATSPSRAPQGPGRYIPHTPFTRLDARVKIIALMAATVGVLSAATPVCVGAWFAVLAACLFGAGLSARAVVRGVRPVAVILAFTFVANAVSCSGDAVAALGAPAFDAAGALRGLLAVARIVVLVGLSLSVAVSTSATEISDACVRLLAPLGRAGVPVGALGTVLAVALRFIPLVTDELARIRLAQRARGARFDEGGLVEKIRVWAAVLTPLMIGLFRRADRLAEAMAGRCYDAAAAGRAPAPRPLGVGNWAALGGALAVIAALGLL